MAVVALGHGIGSGWYLVIGEARCIECKGSVSSDEEGEKVAGVDIGEEELKTGSEMTWEGSGELESSDRSLDSRVNAVSVHDTGVDGGGGKCEACSGYSGLILDS